MFQNSSLCVEDTPASVTLAMRDRGIVHSPDLRYITVLASLYIEMRSLLPQAMVQ